MKLRISLIIFLFPIISIAQTTTINYTESTLDFANPERGFYRYAATHSYNYTALNATTLTGYRENATTPSGNALYDTYTNLIYRIFYLEDFTNSDISATYLAAVQADFDAARTAGVKLIVRFAYTNNVDGSSCDNWICPPYGDASKAWVLSHIEQLKPYLIANMDVISVVQMGFIGTWGEGYYTDYFGDASLAPYILTETNWDDRTEVLNAYLDAVPNERMIQVRYPQSKQKAIYGSLAGTNSAAISSSQAYDGSNISRIGHHNDCLLASYTDFGTYNNYGPPSSFGDTTNLKPYLANDSKYVPVGGETCFENIPWDNCAADGGVADTELRRMHYSYLNSQYNNDVNNGWVGSCMEDIKKELGYRFVLENGTYSSSVQNGEIVYFEMNLKNVGYAAPYNPRAAEIILRHTVTGNLFFAKLDDDARLWLPGSHHIFAKFCLPRTIPLGNYEVLLNLADPSPALYDKPAYSIRLANDNMWEASTGYNNLGHLLTVKDNYPHPYCSSVNPFKFSSSFASNNFSALDIKPLKNYLILNWNAGIDNSNGLYLQRSTDGVNFVNLKWIEGKTDTKENIPYTYIDKNIQKDSPYYYRLEQENIDGSKNHSTIKLGQIKSKNQVNYNLQIAPNPAKSELQISIPKDINTEFHIEILDTNGRLVQETRIKNFNQSSVYLDIKSLKSGLFYIRLKNFQHHYITKFVKY